MGTAAIPGGKAIAAATARLTIGDLDLTQPIPENAVEVSFRTPLKKGKAKLQTWFTDDRTGVSRGAYYVIAERLGPIR